MSTKPRVVILDRDRQFASYVSLIAQGCALAPLVADGLQNFAVLVKSNPEYLMVDMQYPGLDGIQVLTLLGGEENSSKVILMGNHDPGLVDACQAYAELVGVMLVGTLSKPFGVAELKGITRDADRKAQRGHLLSDREVEERLGEGGLEVYYQPKVVIDGGAVSGLEALARLRDGDVIIAADQFIEVAERPHLASAFTRMVIKRVLRDLTTWRDQYDLAPSVAVNLPIRVLENDHFTDWLRMQVEDAAIAPAQIILEITERSASDQYTSLLRAALRLRLHGFALAIDDFGTGFSNEERLLRLPFSELKIDGSLVRALDEPWAIEKVRRAQALASSLRLALVGEGVEQMAQADSLRLLGVDQAQGFGYARPMPHHDVPEWIRPRGLLEPHHKAAG